jgi:CheY-like chemotaxis protein
MKPEGPPGATVEERRLLHDRLADLGMLAAGMAHDYNNILGAIILYSEILLASGDLREDDRERIQVIRDQATRGARLTTQILDYTRRSDVERRPTELKSLLLETTRLLEALLPRRIEVQAEFYGEVFVVNADPGRLQQALMNLAINARDAMPAGGMLRFRLRTFHLASEEPPPYRDMSPGDWVQLDVSDTGNGIPDHVLPHIFRPFFTTKPPGKGTGLGLAQVYGIVKRHGGYLDVQSTAGVGSTFIVYLPADARRPEVVETPADREPAPADRRKVLVIEDDDATRPALVQALQLLGYEAMSAGSGREGSERLCAEGGDVDVVVCDVHLPDGDGEELARLLGQEWARPQFVLMSGYSSGWDTRQASAESRYRWLEKPFTIEDVRRALLSASAGRSTA